MRVLSDRQRPLNYGASLAWRSQASPWRRILIRLFALPLPSTFDHGQTWAVAPIASRAFNAPLHHGPAQRAASLGFREDSPNYSDTGKITIHLHPDGGDCIFDCHRGADPEQRLRHGLLPPLLGVSPDAVGTSLPRRKLNDSPAPSTVGSCLWSHHAVSRWTCGKRLQ